jgi:hypothetical protein
LLTVGGSYGLGAPHELTAPHRRTPQQAASHLASPDRQAASSRSSARGFDGGAAFQVQKLLAEHVERGAPPGREVMLAAYRAPLAECIRYFGPLRPVDLRV